MTACHEFENMLVFVGPASDSCTGSHQEAGGLPEVATRLVRPKKPWDANRGRASFVTSPRETAGAVKMFLSYLCIYPGGGGCFTGIPKRLSGSGRSPLT